MNIGHLKVGKDAPPMIIAEMSANHNKSLSRALEIVDAAAASGVHAVKLQTYTAETMTLDLREKEFFINDPKSLWQGKSLYELYEQAHTPWDWHAPIMERCRQHGLLCFSTPFDETAVDFLETLEVPCYKIASFENIDIPLIQKVAQTGKPIIISTGMANVAELHTTVTAAREANCQDLVLLKCTSTYPASPEDSNISTIPHMQQLFDVHVGLSDHTLGIAVAVASVVLGAVVIEKHFTLDRNEGGVDAAFSLEPAEMKSLVEETRRAWQAKGQVHYGLTEKEKNSQVFRRSIYVAQDIKKGERFTKENLRRIRPGLGLAPKHYANILGQKASQDLTKGTPMSFAYVQPS